MRQEEELRLKPDPGIVFEDKASLKRPVTLAAPTKQRRALPLWGSAAAAAVVAVGVLLLRPADVLLDTGSLPDIAANTEPAKVAPPQPVVEPPVEVAVQPVKTAVPAAQAADPARAKIVQEEKAIEREEFTLIAPTESLLAMTLPERPMTLEMEHAFTSSKEALRFNRSLYEMAAQAIAEERPRGRQLLDEIGEKGIIAFNALAGHKTMVAKTYDAEGNLTRRQVTSLGLNMNRNYEQ